MAERTLHAGDALIVYTDGLIEHNPRLSAEGALDQIIRDSSARSAEELVDSLQRAAAQARDDVAILVALVAPREPNR